MSYLICRWTPHWWTLSLPLLAYTMESEITGPKIATLEAGMPFLNSSWLTQQSVLLGTRMRYLYIPFSDLILKLRTRPLWRFCLCTPSSCFSGNQVEGGSVGAESGLLCGPWGMGCLKLPCCLRIQPREGMMVIERFVYFHLCRAFSFILFQVGEVYLHISTLNAEMHSW